MCPPQTGDRKLRPVKAVVGQSGGMLCAQGPATLALMQYCSFRALFGVAMRDYPERQVSS